MYKFKSGYINPSAFSQRKVWHDGKGKQYQIDQMPIPYALAVIEYLYKKKPVGWSSDCELMRGLRSRIINYFTPKTLDQDNPFAKHNKITRNTFY